MRIAISPGHGMNGQGGVDPGAVNETLGFAEHPQAIFLVQALAEHARLAGIDVFMLPAPLPLLEKVQRVNQRHGDTPFDWAIEVHFNSFADPSAHGTEVCYLSQGNEGPAARVSQALSWALCTEDRGPKKRRNLMWLRSTLPPALLVETLFLSNNVEAEKINDPAFRGAVAAAIVQGLR